MSVTPVSPPRQPGALAREHMSVAAAIHQQRVLPTRIRRIVSPQELKASQALRGRAVLDRGWPVDLADGLDRDEYDSGAVHVGGWCDRELVASGRLVFPDEFSPLPTEAAFDLRLPDRGWIVDVGRVVVAPEATDAGSRVLLALIGGLWHHADGRHLWLGTNTAGMIRLYRRLGARPALLGPAREYCGEWRYPVLWDLDQFSTSYLELACGR